MKYRGWLALVMGSKLIIVCCVLSIITVHHLCSQKWLDSISAQEDVKKDLREQCEGPGKEINCAQQINKLNSNGQTGLMVQAPLGRYEDVSTLLAYGADPNIISNDTQRTTALHLACRAADFADGEKIIRALLKKGASVHSKDAHGNIPLHDLLSAASAVKKQRLTTLMISRYKVKVNEQNNDGDTPLHIAVTKNDLDWITYMTKKHPRVFNYQLKNNQGYTPLGLAQLYGYDQIVELLQQVMR